MPRRAYEEWNPRGEALDVVSHAASICREYREQGYQLTLRQLYYQFVARGIIPNNFRSYKRLGSIVDRARMSGLLDWSDIVDRTRNLARLPHWDTPADVLDSAASSYANDRWADQPRRVEVWVEKEALSQVVQVAADRFDCAWFACRGYVSQSEMWGAAQRIGRYIEAGQAVTILHLGDHDPSGIDMTRDIRDRLTTFTVGDWYRAHRSEHGAMSHANVMATMDEQTGSLGVPYGFEVERIALNMDQIDQYQPPPNPAKLTDSRAEDYISRFGDQSWELDALDPSVLDALISTEIEVRLDRGRFQEAVEAEDDGREWIREAAQASRDGWSWDESS